MKKFPRRINSDTSISTPPPAMQDIDISDLLPGFSNLDSGVHDTNEIYFYDDVNKETALNLLKQLDASVKYCEIARIKYGLDTPPNIKLYICSDGGDLNGAIAIYDRIKALKTVKVHTFIEGSAASAATIISIAGHKRYIRPNSNALIHQLSTGFWGKFNEFEDEMKNLNLYMDTISKIYLQRTSMTKKQLSSLLKQDLYLSSDECLKFKIVDEIIS